MHPLDQIRLRGLHRHMVVIAHHYQRVQPPPVQFARLQHGLLKRLCRTHGAKHIPAIIAPINHMVQSTLILDPQLSRHTGKRARRSVEANSIVAPSGLTPSDFAPFLSLFSGSPD